MLISVRGYHSSVISQFLNEALVKDSDVILDTHTQTQSKEWLFCHCKSDHWANTHSACWRLRVARDAHIKCVKAKPGVQDPKHFFGIHVTAGWFVSIELKTAYTLVQGTVMASAEVKHMTADTCCFNFFIVLSSGSEDIQLAATIRTVTQLWIPFLIKKISWWFFDGFHLKSLTVDRLLHVIPSLFFFTAA